MAPPFTLQLTLSTPSGFPVSGSFSTTDGSAVAPGGYAAAVLQPFTFPPGTTSTGIPSQPSRP